MVIESSDKRTVVNMLFLILFSLFCFSLVLALTKDIEQESESATSEGSTIPTATTDTCAEGYTCIAGSKATKTEPATPPSLTVTSDAPLTKFENIPAGTEIYTEYGDFTGADLSNAVFGNGGLYEATITGIAAGTTMYFLSSFDDQLFKLEAGSDASEVRVVQFQKDGSSQERIYFDLAEGDIISQGSLLEEADYHFLAQGDDSVYIYNKKYGFIIF